MTRNQINNKYQLPIKKTINLVIGNWSLFRHWWLVIGFLLFFAFFLRVWQLSRFPPGFTPDEAAQGYTAWSILKTGKDEWGVRLPLNPRSFGDFKPPLQTYLIIPSVAVFGLTKFAVRLPNAFLAALAPLGVFLLAKELFGSFQIGALSALLLAFSPWHIQLSRGAFEANLTVFFTSFGMYFFVKMLEEKRWYWQVLSAIFLGLNLFSYHSAKIITPLVVGVLYLGLGEVANTRRRLSVLNRPLFVVLFLLFLIVAYSSFFTGGQTRGLDIAIFHPTDNWQAVKEECWWAVKNGLPDGLARLFHNKLTYTASRFLKNYLSYLSPQFLFTEGPGEGTYGMIPGRGVLWWWELPALLFGVCRAIKKPTRKILLVVAAILLAPLPAALTKGVRSANRAAVMMPWIQIFSAWCLGSFLECFEKRPKMFFIVKTGLLFAAGISFLFFLEEYFIQSPRKIAKAMLYGRCEAVRWVAKRAGGADQIIVSRKLSEPQAYVMFCLKYPPLEAQKEVPNWLVYEERGLTFVDQLGEYHLGKFTFKEITPEDWKKQNTILVGVPEEFGETRKANKIIYYPDGKPATFIYKNSKNVQAN